MSSALSKDITISIYSLLIHERCDVYTAIALSSTSRFMRTCLQQFLGEYECEARLDSDLPIVVAFLQRWFRTCIDRMRYGVEDSPIRWQFQLWNYLDAGEHDHNGFWWVDGSDTGDADGDDDDDDDGDDRCRGVHLLRIKHDTAKFWAERTANYGADDVVQAEQQQVRNTVISARLRSGNRVPLDSLLLDYFHPIFPRKLYRISAHDDGDDHSCVPVLMNEDAQCDRLYGMISRRYSSKMRYPDDWDYGVECSMPKIFRGFRDAADDHPERQSYLFAELQLVALPVHACHDEAQVQWYEERIARDAQYRPTVVLLSPMHLITSFPPLLQGAMVVDGHHKLEACRRSARACRLILFEMSMASRGHDAKARYKRFEEPFGPLPWRHPTAEFIDAVKSVVNQDM